ncbi:MAG: HD domain-containing protein [Mycobacteriales bacterium]
MTRERLIRDPVYGYISLPAELAPVVDHPLFQRLRRVAQTSLTSSVYPSATGSRFEHSLGAMHLARRGWRAAWNNGINAQADIAAAIAGDLPNTFSSQTSQPGQAHAARLAERLGLAVAGAALLHDVGHPPFSHVLEEQFTAQAHEFLKNRPDELEEFRSFRSHFHEFAGVLIARDLIKELPTDLRLLTSRIYEADPDASTWAGALHSIVAGEIDVDRLDYLMRDAQKAGTEFGSIDYERLIDALELHSPGDLFRIAPGVRARSAVETLLLQRAQSYRWITFHPRVLSTNAALGRALSATWDLTKATDVVGSQEGDRHLGELVQANLPTLNYLAPSVEDLRRASGLPAVAETASGAQLDLIEQANAEQLNRSAILVQAGIDDSTVIELLKRVSLLATQVLPELSGATREVALRVITYAQAALFREKNAVPVWKTADEYHAAIVKTTGFLDQVRRTVEAVHDELASRSKGSTDLVPVFMARKKQLLEDFERKPLSAVNEVFHDVFTSANVRDKLELRLSTEYPHLRNQPGSWVVQYIPFQPIRVEGQLSVLYRGEDPLELRNTSRVLGGLEALEATRPRLAIFFFLTHPLSAARWGPAESVEAREILTGDAFALIPQFISEVWADHLSARFGLSQGSIAR